MCHIHLYFIVHLISLFQRRKKEKKKNAGLFQQNENGYFSDSLMET